MRIKIIFATVMSTSLIASSASAFELINPLSAITSAVEAAVEDRRAEDIAADTKIKASILADITEQMGADVASVSTDVYEQDVMLTGVVETSGQKDQAGKIAKSIQGVKTLYNEILVIKKTDQDKGMAEAFVEDTVIEKKTNALLLDAKGVNVTNFRWRCVGGHVFLFGRALGQDELAKAVKVVKGIQNVTKVTSRVKVKPKG